MERRLCDLVNLVENNHDCVILEVKPDTKPFDLIRLGGFNGDEMMFRVSKDPSTISVSIFRKGEKPFSMSYGGSVTLVSENLKTMRDLIRECVNLDFGIFTERPFGGKDFDMLVKRTSGERTLDSPRRFELQKGDSYYSLFVNDQHIARIDNDKLETWLDDRNIQMELIDEGRWSDVGYLHRLAGPNQEERSISHTIIARFGTTALVFTGLESPEPYVVARNYNEERGDWSSGSYYTNLAAAWEEAGGEQDTPHERKPIFALTRTMEEYYATREFEVIAVSEDKGLLRQGMERWARMNDGRTFEDNGIATRTEDSIESNYVNDYVSYDIFEVPSLVNEQDLERLQKPFIPKEGVREENKELCASNSVEKNEERPDTICTITWSREDIAMKLADLGFEPSDQNIDLFADQASRTLQDISVMYGWDIITECINDIEDQLIKSEPVKNDEKKLDKLVKDAEEKATEQNVMRPNSLKNDRETEINRGR